MSLNDYCAGKLALPGGPTAGGARAVLERAAAVFADALLGLVAFGSWARDELADTSDVDLLVVLEPAVAITRELYHAWDAEPVRWDGRPVEPHFVHLPDPAGRLSGVWAEAALEGIVLFERGLVVSRRLVEVRRRIAAGQVVRRRAHGHPYWIEVA
jgi:hypothetical protein